MGLFLFSGNGCWGLSHSLGELEEEGVGNFTPWGSFPVFCGFECGLSGSWIVGVSGRFVWSVMLFECDYGFVVSVVCVFVSCF